MPDSDEAPSDGWAQATTQVAKTVSDYEKHAAAVGQFVDKIIGHPAQQVGGVVGDIVAMARAEIMWKFIPRYQRKMKELGIKDPKALPLGLAYPLLDAASLEENEQLADMFAGLLATYVSEGGSGGTPKSFIATVRSMSALEAQVLNKLVAAAPGDMPESFLLTHWLPDEARHVADNRGGLDKYPKPTPDVQLALAGLQRLGCVQAAQAMDMNTYFQQARATYYGRRLIQACLVASDV